MNIARASRNVAANNGPGFLKKLNTCVANNAKNYSIGGVANLVFNTQIPGAGTECAASSGGTHGFRVRVWERVGLRATARTQARAFCGTATLCREVRRRAAKRNG